MILVLLELKGFKIMAATLGQLFIYLYMEKIMNQSICQRQIGYGASTSQKKTAGYSFEPFQSIGFRVYDDGYKDTWLVVKYATTEKPKSSDWLIGWCSKGDRDRKEASWCKVEFEHKGLFFRAQFLEKNLPIKKQVISGLTQIIDSWREQCRSP